MGFALAPNAKRRLVTGFSLVLGFGLVISLGHFYLTLFIFTVTHLVFWEVFHLRRDHPREAHIRLNVALNFPIFSVCTLACFTRQLLRTARPRSLALLRVMARGAPPLFFLAYAVCLAAWALTLRRGRRGYQLRLFLFTHLSFLVAAVGSMAVPLVYAGVVWWLTGTLLVVVNDVAAYAVGKHVGRRPLTALSPGKTLEGFLGGAVFTLLAACLWSRLMLLRCFRPLLCRQVYLTARPFTFDCCELPEVFRPGPHGVTAFDAHCLVLAALASLGAPLGGMLCSALKRRLGVKNFSEWLPGHGGFLDRFDCEIAMTLLSNVYLRRALAPTLPTLLYHTARLSPEDARSVVTWLGLS